MLPLRMSRIALHESAGWLTALESGGAQKRYGDDVPLDLADDRLQKPFLLEEGFHQLVPKQSSGWVRAKAKLRRADHPRSGQRPPFDLN